MLLQLVSYPPAWVQPFDVSIGNMIIPKAFIEQQLYPYHKFRSLHLLDDGMSISAFFEPENRWAVSVVNNFAYFLTDDMLRNAIRSYVFWRLLPEFQCLVDEAEHVFPDVISEYVAHNLTQSFDRLISRYSWFHSSPVSFLYDVLTGDIWLWHLRLEPTEDGSLYEGVLTQMEIS